MKTNSPKNASTSKVSDWELVPTKPSKIDLGNWSDKLSSKTAKLFGYSQKAAVQVWDELNNSWSIPWCDISRRQAELVVKRWTHDLVCKDQLPLWAIENYTRAADEEGETYLKRYRHLYISIRHYLNKDDEFMASCQETVYSLLLVPVISDVGMTWRAVRIQLPCTSPREALGDYMSDRPKSYKVLEWTAKRLPWELKVPRRSAERQFYDGVR